MNGIFFISNGYGEDSITLSLIRAIAEKDPLRPIYALPLVGAGEAYENVKCEIVGSRAVMPSGGMIPGNPGNLARDLKSGLVSLTLYQMKMIREYSHKSDVVVAVGDIYPALLASICAHPPRVMVATAKSNYVSPHNLFEKLIMRFNFDRVFVRDEPTAEHLRQGGVKNALWVGNAMMDCLCDDGVDFGVGDDEFFVAVLPGSRSGAFADMPVIAPAVEKVHARLGGFFAAVLAPSINPAYLARTVSEDGWVFDPERKDSMIGKMCKGNLSIVFYRKGMADLLHAADIVIGQAGTANEQAAGLGKPIVAFDSFSKHGMGWYRKRQKGLLADAVSVVKKDPDAVADEICKIMNDKAIYDRMAAAGLERLGPAGGAGKMADYILSLSS